MFILEQKYGNDGYAFWFKILELLASNEGHYYDCRNIAKWQFLQAKTHLSENICIEILTLLANLKAIDPELWNQKVIWSDNFVTGISDVYRNRRVETPPKPTFLLVEIPYIDKVSTDINPQSKVKERKGKERKGKALSLTDDEWIQELKKNPAYNGLDIEAEQGKCLAWFQNKGITVSRQRFLNWLNKADKIMQSKPESRRHLGLQEFAKGG